MSYFETYPYHPILLVTSPEIYDIPQVLQNVQSQVFNDFISFFHDLNFGQMFPHLCRGWGDEW